MKKKVSAFPVGLFVPIFIATGWSELSRCQVHPYDIYHTATLYSQEEGGPTEAAKYQQERASGIFSLLDTSNNFPNWT
ncbi:hypothetical protein B0T17DRAFT_524532 [Bombardia bombarda]|uniref:Uncharacterized protein n=1 Tax=Bombardia bombarda TaxID=252184 RepID=A0AA39X8V2_9PEZI|nr:hypothetical protein B0T17DRAFT_524532 [Bombardia bombarda]